MYESKKLLRKNPSDRHNLIKTVEENPRMGIYCGKVLRVFSEEGPYTSFNSYFYDSAYGRKWLSIACKVDLPYEVILPECLL